MSGYKDLYFTGHLGDGCVSIETDSNCLLLSLDQAENLRDELELFIEANQRFYGSGAQLKSVLVADKEV